MYAIPLLFQSALASTEDGKTLYQTIGVQILLSFQLWMDKHSLLWPDLPTSALQDLSFQHLDLSPLS